METQGNRFVTASDLTPTISTVVLLPMKYQMIILVSGTILGSSLSAQNLSVFDLPQGNQILQLTGADAISTPGGNATADTRTLYYLQDDFGDPAPNTHDWTLNTAWPYVYVSGSLNIDPAISASVTTFDDGDAGTGDVLLVDGNPLYQFVNDNSSTDANGNFGPWFFVEPDGSATQSVVPEPSTYALFGGLLVFGFVFSRRLRHPRPSS